MTWLRDILAHDKAVIAMVHFPPLPGAPLYDDKESLKPILERIFHDVEALQAGGVDGLMFCNENDRPYVMKADPVTIAVMARTIMVVFANTGTRADNVAEKLSVADGVVVGTSLKAGGITWNPVDVERVRAFMAAVRRARGE